MNLVHTLIHKRWVFFFFMYFFSSPHLPALPTILHPLCNQKCSNAPSAICCVSFSMDSLIVNHSSLTITVIVVTMVTYTTVM